MKNTLTCIAMVALLVACDGKSQKDMNKTLSQKSSMSCPDVKYGSDKYFDNMDRLTQLAGMDRWNRNTETFVSSLCTGDTKGADISVQNGAAKADQATKIASILGIQYSAQNLSVSPPVASEPQSIKPIGPYCGKITAISQYVADSIGRRYNTDARYVDFDYANEANPETFTCTVALQTRVGPKFCSATEIWLIGNQYVAGGVCRQ